MNHKLQKYEQSANLKLPIGLVVWVGKLVILSLTLYYLQEAIQNARTHSAFSLESLQKVWTNGSLGVCLAAVLLPLNWGMEARKWQYLASKVEKLSYLKAYKAVLTGLTLGFVTPNRVGDYAGRILTMHQQNRADAIGAILLGRLCQLFCTVLVGSAGLAYFFFKYYIPLATPVGISVFIALLFVNGWAIALLFSFQWAVKFLERVPYLHKWVHYVAVIGQFSNAELCRVLWLSALRYAVFMGQFICLLYAFGVALEPDQYVWGVAGTFLLKSVVPSVNALADIGMRELSAMHFFGLMGQDSLMVLGASLSLWGINIALPSLIGLVFVLPLKLSGSR